MEENSFEQQFQQDVKASMPQPVVNNATGSKLPLVIAVALAAVVLVESIALVVTLNNYFALINEEEVFDEVVLEVEDDGVYVYDDDNNLVAMNITCTAEDGAKYSLTNTKNYQQYDDSTNLIDSGPYSITNDSLVSLSGSDDELEKVLYYDGYTLADGLKVYDCEDDITDTTE